MALSGWIGLAVGAATGVYCAYSAYTETGLAGWMFYAQQSVFGSYSLKMTVLLLTLVTVFAGAGAVFLAEMVGLGGRGGAEPSPAARAAAAEPKPVGWGGYLGLAAGMAAATWAIGLGIYGWNSRTDAEDAKARYERVVLGDPAPAPSAAHLSLSGRLLGDKVLTHQRKKTGSTTVDYHYVPMAEPDWTEGRPVRYVIKVKSLSVFNPPSPRTWVPPGQRREAQRPAAPPPVLGRIDGDVPVAAAQAFKQIGVPLADGAKVVRWIPSNDGVPAVPDTHEQDWNVTLIVCGLVSGLLVFAMLFAGWLAQRKQRQDRKLAAAAAG